MANVQGLSFHTVFANERVQQLAAESFVTYTECCICGLPTPTDLEQLDGTHICVDCHFRLYPEDWD